MVQSEVYAAVDFAAAGNMVAGQGLAGKAKEFAEYCQWTSRGRTVTKSLTL